MNCNMHKKYVAYVCTSFNRESFRRVVNVIRAYNKCNIPKITLILAGVPVVEYNEDRNIINIGFSSIVDSEYYEDISAIIVDYEEQLSYIDALSICQDGVVCIVNETYQTLKDFCVQKNCGLYYSDLRELLAVLCYIFDKKNEENSKTLCMRMQKYVQDELVPVTQDADIQANIIARMEAVQEADKELKVSTLLPDERLENLSSQIRTSDSGLYIVCSDDMSIECIDVKILLIYQYIKLFVNPKSEMFFAGNINENDSGYKFIVAQISELGIKDVHFGIPSFSNGIDTILFTKRDVAVLEQECEKYKYVLTMGRGNSKRNIINVYQWDVQYIAELISMLLYNGERCDTNESN